METTDFLLVFYFTLAFFDTPFNFKWYVCPAVIVFFLLPVLALFLPLLPCRVSAGAAPEQRE